MALETGCTKTAPSQFPLGYRHWFASSMIGAKAVENTNSDTTSAVGFQARLAMFEGLGAVESSNTLQTPPVVMRKHRGFLSPTSFNIRQYRKLGGDGEDGQDTNTVELIKQEISALQERVSSIDRANRTHQRRGDHPAVELDPSQDLQELNRKLIHIQAGLVAIEGERRHLVNKSDKQQREKEALEQQILEQTKQLQSFRNKVLDRKREASHLREMNQELSQKVIELKMERSLFESTQQENEVLRQKLCDAEQTTLALDEQCQKMKQTNERAKSALASCVKRLGKIAAKDKEDAEIQARFDQKYQETLEENNTLKQELLEKEASIENVSKELSSLKSMPPAESAPSNAAIEELESQLQMKDSEISSLRSGFDSQMQELMTTSSELQHLQDECKQMEGLREEVSLLKRERTELEESLHSKETTIAEISAQLLKFDLEREYANQDVQNSPAAPLKQTAVKSAPSPSSLLSLGLSSEALSEVEGCYAKIGTPDQCPALVSP